MADLPTILIVTGPMAVGKSTIAQALAERLPRAVHLHGDVFRKMIVSGRMEPQPGTEAAWRAQLDLRYALAAAAADRYAAAGFTVIWQDIITDALPQALESLKAWSPGVVVLSAAPDVLGARDAARAKTGYRGWTPEAFAGMVRETTPDVGLWLDTSDLGVEAVVQRILDDPTATRRGLEPG